MNEQPIPANAASGDPAVIPAAPVPPSPAPASVAPRGGMTLADLERRFAAGRQAPPASAPNESTATKPAVAQSATTATAPDPTSATAGDVETEAASDPESITPAAAATPEETAAAVENETDPADPTPEAGSESAQKLAKRYNKLVGVVKTKDAELASLQAKVAELEAKATAPAKAAAPAPVPSADPVGWRPEIQQLDASIREAQQALSWANANQDGVTETVDGQEREFTPETVRKIRDGAMQEVARLTARRELTAQKLTEAHQTARQQAVDTVLNAYPWAKDPESAPMKAWADLAQQIPPHVQQVLNGLPDGALLAADLVAGRLARLNAAAPKPASKPAPRPTAQPTGAAAAPVRVNPGQQKAEAVAAEVKAKGKMTVEQLTQRSAARREALRAA